MENKYNANDALSGNNLMKTQRLNDLVHKTAQHRHMEKSYRAYVTVFLEVLTDVAPIRWDLMSFALGGTSPPCANSERPLREQCQTPVSITSTT